VKSHVKSRAGVALQRAEKIKSVHRDLTPVVRNAFSEREYYPVRAVRLVSLGPPESQFAVLKKSSRVNGKTIPLWRDPRLPSEYVSVHGYVPPRLTGIEITLISLNWLRRSLRSSAIWKLPAELCSNWTHSSNDVEPQDIAQRIISDCSVCASIVVCLAHHKRFSSKVG
jgi:calpain-7